LGLTTLGELAALPTPTSSPALVRPLACGRRSHAATTCVRSCRTLADERFESTIELEWPIEGLEPLSFVLTRLIEPLSTRLERRDRGAAVLHVLLGSSPKTRTRAGSSCRRRCATCAR
jgi:hypothetical protein